MTGKLGLQAAMDQSTAVEKMISRAPGWAPGQVLDFIRWFGSSAEPQYRAIASKLQVLATDPAMEKFWEDFLGSNQAERCFSVAMLAVSTANWVEELSCGRGQRLDNIARLCSSLLTELHYDKELAAKIDLGELVQLRESARKQADDARSLPVGKKGKGQDIRTFVVYFDDALRGSGLKVSRENVATVLRVLLNRSIEPESITRLRKKKPK